MDRETGDTHRVSPGIGKTTCAWIHPITNACCSLRRSTIPSHSQASSGDRVPQIGSDPRYAWDYDETYELVAYDTKSGEYTRLTNERGYDAEASYSPDGQWIVFASNRTGYTEKLSPEQKKLFETDPSWAMELYIMKADGSEVRRLTDKPGYDGGPFFSPDGQAICWRRFNENGALAEIMLMNVDGSDHAR